MSCAPVIAPCLSALLLPPLLLLLLASSAFEQVRVVCPLSDAAALARSQRAVARAVKNVFVASPVGAAAAGPTPRWWCPLVVDATSTAIQCAAMLVLNAHGLQTSAVRCTVLARVTVPHYCASILRAQVARERVLNEAL
jgi:hypothetical protein